MIIVFSYRVEPTFLVTVTLKRIKNPKTKIIILAKIRHYNWVCSSFQTRGKIGKWRSRSSTCSTLASCLSSPFATTKATWHSGGTTSIRRRQTHRNWNLRKINSTKKPSSLQKSEFKINLWKAKNQITQKQTNLRLRLVQKVPFKTKSVLVTLI